MPTPRKPTELKLMEGNRGKRALNNQEPQPDFLDNLDAPEWLPDDVKLIWRDLAFKLRRTKVLTILDVPALEKLCVAIATYRRATMQAAGVELVDKDGAAGVKGRASGSAAASQEEGAGKQEGMPKKGAETPPPGTQLNPWLIVQSMAFKQAIQLMREFGMTPAARSRVLIDPQLGLFGNGQEKKGSEYFT